MEDCLRRSMERHGESVYRLALCRLQERPRTPRMSARTSSSGCCRRAIPRLGRGADQGVCSFAAP